MLGRPAVDGEVEGAGHIAVDIPDADQLVSAARGTDVHRERSVGPGLPRPDVADVGPAGTGGTALGVCAAAQLTRRISGQEPRRERQPRHDSKRPNAQPGFETFEIVTEFWPVCSFSVRAAARTFPLVAGSVTMLAGSLLSASISVWGTALEFENRRYATVKPSTALEIEPNVSAPVCPELVWRGPSLVCRFPAR
jgi:hypothetical protein